MRVIWCAIIAAIEQKTSATIGASASTPKPMAIGKPSQPRVRIKYHGTETYHASSIRKPKSKQGVTRHRRASIVVHITTANCITTPATDSGSAEKGCTATNTIENRVSIPETMNKKPNSRQNAFTACPLR